MMLPCAALGNRKFQYFSSISATLCILSSEMHFGWSSPSLPVLTGGNYYFTINKDEASWLAVILLAGTVVGALFAGTFANLLGRKKMVLLTAVPLLTGWLMIALGRNVDVLYAARFIAGMSSGLCFSTVPMYLGEVSEPDIRGMLSSLGPVCVVFGILLINILGNYLPIDTAAYIAGVFPVILFATFVWMPESPSYLLHKNRIHEAKKALTMLRGADEAEKELKRLLECMKDTKDEKATVLDLLRVKVNRKAAVVAYGLRTVQQLCGTTAITFYCKTIFEEAKDILSPNVSTILYFSLQLVFAFASTFVVDKLGRKPLLVTSLFGASSSLLVMTLYLYTKDQLKVDVSAFTAVPFAALLINVCFVSVGVRIVPLLMMGEVFSAKIKPMAVCVGAMYYSMCAMATAKLYHATNEYFGLYFPFLAFTVLGFLSILFVVFVVPETKGKTLEDIQKELAGKRNCIGNGKAKDIPEGGDGNGATDPKRG